MIVTIYQPEHLPWIGYFNKMSKADIYVFLDNVQYEKNNVQNRNRILGTNGAQWITVPVITRGHLDCEIKDMRISNLINPKWRKKYLSTIYMSYKKSPFFKELYPFFEELLSKEYIYLIDLNMEIIRYLAKTLEIKPHFCKASELKEKGKNSDHIVDICNELGASTYLSGTSVGNYLAAERFEQNHISIQYHDFHHPVYKQYNTEEFVSNMSVIDLIFNVGAEKAKRIVKL